MKVVGGMTSAECCEFDKKNQPITSDGIIQVVVHAGIVYESYNNSICSEAFYFKYVVSKIKNP